MKKQTAVEWLQDQLNPDMRTMHGVILQSLLEDAKAMEKEQIIKAFCEGYDHDGDNYDGAEISYYNRTYKGGEQ
jgi:hypothetical protein